MYPYLLRYWDGGPVEIAGTVDEGDDVSGFQVVHLPGHAPGLIGLFRERDRLALTSDCFYVIDPETSRQSPPGPPHPAFNEDTEQARESIRKLAALEPSAAWPGHADPVTGRRARPAGARRLGVMARKRLKAPSYEYRSPDGDVLALRGSMTPGTRLEYAATLGGSPLSQEDAWQRAVEFLFERLAVQLGGRRHRADHAPEGAARALPDGLARDERQWIRDVLREHLAEHFPELAAAVSARPGRVRRAAVRLLPRGRARPAGRRALDHARRAAAARARSARCSSARRGRCCAWRCPSRSAASGRRRATAHLDGFAPAELAEAEATDASLRIARAGEHARARRRRPGPDGPRRARPRAGPRGGAARAAGA